MTTTAPVDPSTDFMRVALGDARLDQRLLAISHALHERPSESFPKAMADEAAIEAFYRFMANDKVEWRRLLDAHLDATHDRALASGTILAVHDSSLCQFGGADVREGAFRTAKNKSGFLAHTCLAVAADGSRQPLGLLGMVPVVRLTGDAAAASPGTVYDNESDRWIDLVGDVHDEVPTEVDIIHVMDSEGDAYDLLEYMCHLEADFVVRLCHDRRVLGELGPERLHDALDRAVTRLERTVRLSPRSGPKGKEANKKRHAERDERVCRLEARVVATRLLRPDSSRAAQPELAIHVVHVVEPDPPEDMEPVSWVLATTRPVDTVAQVEAVIDAYRARWLIEEWFKALKTGCAYQDRQLESLDALLVAFSLLAPVATNLLAIRWFARNEPDRPATDVLTKPEIGCLRMLERSKRRTLPKHPTVADVMLAIARLGGFLKRNKVPGWQTLGRGFEDFRKMFAMYSLMRSGGTEM